MLNQVRRFFLRSTVLRTSSFAGVRHLFLSVGCFGALASLPLAAEPIQLHVIEAMSGPFALAGASVERNLRFAIAQVNAQGGVKLKTGARPLALTFLDSRQETDTALNHLRASVNSGVPFILQGNSSGIASALIEGINKNNERNPKQRALFLNYAAVEPSLTEGQCSFWHFRFDAHAAMRMEALTEVMRTDPQVKKVYLIGQDYSFGRTVLVLARADLGRKRPDVQIVGEALHPLGKVKDFAPYVEKIRVSGADTVITGNWGNDLSLLIRTLRDYQVAPALYTFYGNSLGAPTAIGAAGVGRVRAVAEWHNNLQLPNADQRFLAFTQTYSKPTEDYFQWRFQVMIELLVQAIERAGTTDSRAVALALEGSRYQNSFYHAHMQAQDHQLQQPLIVMQMQAQGEPDVKRAVEGSGFGFKTIARFAPSQLTQPVRCQMQRPTE